MPPEDLPRSPGFAGADGDAGENDFDGDLGGPESGLGDGSPDGASGEPSPPSPEAQPQQQWQGQGQPPQDAPPWSQPPAEPDWQQQTPPWQQPAAQPQAQPGVDWRLLNPDFSAAQEQVIQAHFDAPYRMAATEQERETIRARYETLVMRHRANVERAQVARQQWEVQQQQQNMQRQTLPMLRQMAAETLARQTGLTVDEVLKDRQGRDIWDPHIMHLLAQERAFQKYGQRVQQRRQSGSDSPYAPAGGQGAGDNDIDAMDEKQWQAFQARVRRTGGRALYG